MLWNFCSKPSNEQFLQKLCDMMKHYTCLLYNRSSHYFLRLNSAFKVPGQALQHKDLIEFEKLMLIIQMWIHGSCQLCHEISNLDDLLFNQNGVDGEVVNEKQCSWLLLACVLQKWNRAMKSVRRRHWPWHQ